jgi:hypothetical protein
MSSRGDRIGRAIVAVTIAIAAATVVWILIGQPREHMDFEFLWRGSRAWAHGVDPYAMRPKTRDWPLADRLYYPLPALLLVWPLRWLSLRAAAAIFVAVPSALLAWRMSRRALWPLLLLGTPSFVMAVVLGQWTPWFLVAMYWPVVGVLFTAKPTIGLACLAARPSWRAITGCVAIALLSLALWPLWPLAWLHNLTFVVSHPAPIRTPLGVLLLAALLRWRRPEARLLLAMAVVPQLLLFADQLPLMLVARTKRDAAILLLSGWLCAAMWFVRDAANYGGVRAAEPYVLLGCYLPSLLIVLRRRNEGALPTWLERASASWPRWLRGASASAPATALVTSSSMLP